MAELRFDDRSVIVTGAGRGVGRCHALALAARGARVVVADFGGNLDGSGSSSGPADDVVAEITAAGGAAVSSYASVADEAGAESIVRTAMDAFGRLDVVINNAGIADPDWFEDLPLDRFRRMVDVQLQGTVNVCKAAYPHLIAGGYGRIVNTCSEAGWGLVPKATSYGAGKAGVYGFTRSLAHDSRRYGILVNAVAPRADTRLSGPAVLAKTYDEPVEKFGEGIVAFAPELVTPAALFLAHESCSLTGEVLVCGGGGVMRIVASMNTGYTSPNLTPEEIAANLDTVMDMSDAHVLHLFAHEEARAAR